MVMASRPWTDSDVAFLKTLADRRDWITKAVAKFPDRTEAAVRCMMQKVRQDIGSTDSRFCDNAWMASAAHASKQLLIALETTGLRP